MKLDLGIFHPKELLTEPPGYLLIWLLILVSFLTLKL